MALYEYAFVFEKKNPWTRRKIKNKYSIVYYALAVTLEFTLPVPNDL